MKIILSSPFKVFIRMFKIKFTTKLNDVRESLRRRLIDGRLAPLSARLEGTRVSQIKLTISNIFIQLRDINVFRNENVMFSQNKDEQREH
jgi:hypothetical protein